VINTKVYPLELAEDLIFRLLGIKVEDLTKKKRKAYRIYAREGVVISKIKKIPTLTKSAHSPAM
jgi:hypothetical protein